MTATNFNKGGSTLFFHNVLTANKVPIILTKPGLHFFKMGPILPHPLPVGISLHRSYGSGSLTMTLRTQSNR